MKVPPIEQLFKEWVDFDVAEYFLACRLGIVKFDESYDEFRRTKGVYNTKNPIGDMLYSMLEQLSDVGILIRGDDGYKWNDKSSFYWLNPDISRSSVY